MRGGDNVIVREPGDSVGRACVPCGLFGPEGNFAFCLCLQINTINPSTEAEKGYTEFRQPKLYVCAEHLRPGVSTAKLAISSGGSTQRTSSAGVLRTANR